MGVCINDEAFKPFWDDDGIIENFDFSSCYEIYLEKRFDGEREACDQFEEPEILDIPEGEDINAYLLLERMKYQNVDEIIKYFYDPDYKNVSKAVSFISTYINIGNQDAYEGLIKYYRSLGPVVSLEDAHLRMKIVDTLSRKKSEKSTIEAYVNELARTPSNNTTRKLYTLILKNLEGCPNEMVREPLILLLKKRQYSYKMKKRIMEIIKGVEKAPPGEIFYFFQ
ncbi:MAG: hypothetical protein ACOX1J_00885 [Dethiobacteria bacterium]|jgi:hypothetical protein